MGVALLDSSVVIAALSRDDVHHEDVVDVVRTTRAAHALAISTLTYSGILVGPLRAGPAAVEAVERFVELTELVPVSRDIARRAAQLRSQHGVKLPDAVIVATGLEIEAAAILTTDRRWSALPMVSVVGGSR